MKGKKHPTNNITINPSDNDSILDIISRASVGRRPLRPHRNQHCDSRDARRRDDTWSSSNRRRRSDSGFPNQRVWWHRLREHTAEPGTARRTRSPCRRLLRRGAGCVGRSNHARRPRMVGGRNAGRRSRRQSSSECTTTACTFSRSRGDAVASSRRGVLCVNHEYTHEQILHGPEGLTGGAASPSRKCASRRLRTESRCSTS